ncbi:MAG: quinone-dependent dihydroorotate dehydrogenase [Alphaproteobacteria bacterium]|nr:quinone-dependent dihydroorotate dehydrogenase [Alphaproteobacteria bacterium]
MYKTLKPLIFSLSPETAHRLTLFALKHVPVVLLPRPQSNSPRLKVTLWGRSFPNPVGLAAGFDKNAESLNGLFRLGFGFIEAGTVTLKPQSGNPRPRVFRCPEHNAVINRMGFPNCGVVTFQDNLRKFLEKKPRPNGVLGLNIGMNKDQTEPSKDYVALVRLLAPMADYLTINISSPNTPGLRNLQEKEPLRELLSAVLAERKASCGDFQPPLLVKLAPDLTDTQIDDIASVLLDLKIDGVILSNTTLSRPENLPVAFREEKGGLSGAPLTDLSTSIIRRFYSATKGEIPIIGVGGIGSAKDAYTKIRAGASLIQIYSNLIFHGPSLPSMINTGLIDLLQQDGFSHISEAVGADHRTNTTKNDPGDTQENDGTAKLA